MSKSIDKNDVKHWLLNHCLKNDNILDLSELDFTDMENLIIDLRGIKTNGIIRNSKQKAQYIFQEKQNAEIIYQDFQEAKSIFQENSTADEMIEKFFVKKITNEMRG